MPQMAPYNWLILFLMFNLINMIMINYNYYLNLPQLNQKIKILKIIKFNLKW